MKQQKQVQKRGNKALKIVLTTVLALAVIVGGFVTFVLAGKERAIHLPLKSVSLASIADGVYKGRYDGFRWSNAVEVTVANQTIIGIRALKKQVYIKEETMKELTKRVVATQRADVDVVSGATADSKAFLKAVENALTKVVDKQ